MKGQLSIEKEENLNRSAKRQEILSQRDIQKNEILEKLGEEKYMEIFEVLVNYRSQPEVDEREMYLEVKNRMHGVKEHLNLAFKLDNIIFHELVLENLHSRTQL